MIAREKFEMTYQIVHAGQNLPQLNTAFSISSPKNIDMTSSSSNRRYFRGRSRADSRSVKATASPMASPYAKKAKRRLLATKPQARLSSQSS